MAAPSHAGASACEADGNRKFAVMERAIGPAALGLQQAVSEHLLPALTSVFAS